MIEKQKHAKISDPSIIYNKKKVNTITVNILRKINSKNKCRKKMFRDYYRKNYRQHNSPLWNSALTAERGAWTQRMGRRVKSPHTSVLPGPERRYKLDIKTQIAFRRVALCHKILDACREGNNNSHQPVRK